MSRKYLGEQIDIHAGGEDLYFLIMRMRSFKARHQRERICKVLMHNAFINVDNKNVKTEATLQFVKYASNLTHRLSGSSC